MAGLAGAEDDVMPIAGMSKRVLYVDPSGKILGVLNQAAPPKLTAKHRDLEGGRRYVAIEVTDDEAQDLLDRRVKLGDGDRLERLPEEDWPLSNAERVTAQKMWDRFHSGLVEELARKKAIELVGE